MASYAGNIRADTPGHPNNTLCFCAVEHADQSGSLTARAGDRPSDPYLVWLNGGPEASSFNGFFEENGPLRIQSNLSIENNIWAWSMLVDVIWVDHPIGVGFSTADSNGYVTDETRMGQDFVSFLANLVNVFPSLKTRPLYLTGERCASLSCVISQRFMVSSIVDTGNGEAERRSVQCGTVPFNLVVIRGSRYDDLMRRYLDGATFTMNLWLVLLLNVPTEMAARSYLYFIFESLRLSRFQLLEQDNPVSGSST